jgi:hypothetical protein
MSSAKIYMIVLMDSASDSYNYGVFEEDDSNKAYASLDAAKDALVRASEKYGNFLPTAYGEAYPYESVTFEQLLEKDGFAPWGWGLEEIDDNSYRICVGLLVISVN